VFTKEYQVEVESCLEKPAEESSAEGKKRYNTGRTPQHFLAGQLVWLKAHTPESCWKQILNYTGTPLALTV